MALTVLHDDLSGEQVRDLLAYHFAEMRGSSPPGACHILDYNALLDPTIAVWSAWEKPSLAAIGALKNHGHGLGEIKSMRTHPDHLRKGAARAILDRIVSEAQQKGYARLSLETGNGALFQPALAMYRAYGFLPGQPLAGYAPTDFTVFLHLDL